jgi:hypothetical protein
VPDVRVTIEDKVYTLEVPGIRPITIRVRGPLAIPVITMSGGGG